MTTSQFYPNSAHLEGHTHSLKARVYKRMTETTSIVFQSEYDEVEVATTGADPKALVQFFGAMNKKDMPWIIPVRTFQHRIAKHQKLSQEETGKFVRAAHIVALAEEVFANKDKALDWLDRPIPDFGGKSANEFMQTEFGGRMVEDALYRINEGYFA